MVLLTDVLMMQMSYTYLVWSLILLSLWGGVFLFSPDREKMIRMSLGTAPLGLSEPLFYPEYWFPPTVFDLGARTGFDIESIVFSFAVGGLASSVYGLWRRDKRETLTASERHHNRHRFHYLALGAPVVCFLALEWLTTLNTIYTASLSLLAGSAGTIVCRPDLLKRVVKGGVIFTVVYFLFFSAMNLSHPDYVRLYWNHAQISGLSILGIPVEELMFAFTFGSMWSGFYEHRWWLR
jgi:hypothetical protein